MAEANPADRDAAPTFQVPGLDQMQHWTRVIGQAQQMMLEHAAQAMASAPGPDVQPRLPYDPDALAHVQSEFARDALGLWRRFLESGGSPLTPAPESERPATDRRFSDSRWQENPVFDVIRQSYLLLSDALLRMTDTLEGVDPREREKIRFVTAGLVDALSPSNFPFTNPAVLERTLETGGENLLKGLRHMLADLEKGQLTQSDGAAFELGRNIAATPGKVIKETPLYQLIQYTPTTPHVMKTPVVIFPPWINRFYILDLTPEKSFVRWAVEQGISLFMVSWKSADATMADVDMDDYVLAQAEVIDTVRELLEVPSVHTVGYCVAGTTLATTLALLAARGAGDKVASATFFTAQVDFSRAGELLLFVDDAQLMLAETLSSQGYLDGRYMAATFNLLRGRDLIWSYVVNNYLLGQDYAPFDLLHWNSDFTNLPARWHREYITSLYRDNRLVQPGSLLIDGTPIDLTQVETPSYVQAGREDHIAPAESVWKITEHFAGPLRFLLAGSGHIAGVVNPPHKGKYGYWTNDSQAQSLDDFIATATEHKGSWWPDWFRWLEDLGSESVPAEGPRQPGQGALKAIEDAPGRYVRTR